MKFPSFIKTAKHERFHYEPRYYDPIKEEIQGKIAAAKRQTELGKKHTELYSLNISAGFSKRERKSNQSSWVQMAIAAVLMGSFIGWLYLGEDFFYVYLFLMPVYLYFRLKKRTNNK